MSLCNSSSYSHSRSSSLSSCVASPGGIEFISGGDLIADAFFSCSTEAGTLFFLFFETPFSFEAVDLFEPLEQFDLADCLDRGLGLGRSYPLMMFIKPFRSCWEDLRSLLAKDSVTPLNLSFCMLGSVNSKSALYLLASFGSVSSLLVGGSFVFGFLFSKLKSP